MEQRIRLIDLIRDHLEIVQNLDQDSKLADIGYDSLRFIELVIKIEVEFDIEFDDELLNFRRFKDIGGIDEYITLKVQQK